MPIQLLRARLYLSASAQHLQPNVLLEPYNIARSNPVEMSHPYQNKTGDEVIVQFKDDLLGKLIETAREKKHLTREALAQELGIGVRHMLG